MERIKIIIDEAILLEYEKYYFSIHTRAKKKPIPHPYHESINEWMIMKRPQMNALKQKWKDFIIWLVDYYGYSDFGISQCEITQKIYFGINRRHDNDNNVPKFILDGFVASGMIVDDDSCHISKLSLECDVDKDRPRTEFTVRILN